MFTLKIVSNRPDKSAEFFRNSPAGQSYNAVIEQVVAAFPTTGPSALVDASNETSVDGLQHIMIKTFTNEAAKESFKAATEAAIAAAGLVDLVATRLEYNESVGHWTSVEKIQN
jgi:1,2-phenylacetyl-CoA epoxidase catalytic subunit